ncbi:MAG: hypothetical protein ABFD98_17670 [Syntrophobacteraceae bacterium]|nr:hypothetical protein [Desulfobacteraceae bacterium]
MPRTGFLRQCAPTVDRSWLLLLSGILWSVVGISLCIMACRWLSEMQWPMQILGIVAGFGPGIPAYLFGFSRIARKNIARIGEKPDRVCLFAFQAWRSYLLILVMILLGYALRHSHLSQLVVAVIYSAVGTGLTFSSTLYYAAFFAIGL